MLSKILISLAPLNFIWRFLYKPRFVTPDGIIFSLNAGNEQGQQSETAQGQPEWDHEEMALLIVEYFYYKNSASGIKKSNQFVSAILRKRGKRLGIKVGEKYRNLRGIECQRENLSHFDPESNIAPTGHESRWMIDIMDEYLKNPEAIKREAYELIKKYAVE